MVLGRAIESYGDGTRHGKKNRRADETYDLHPSAIEKRFHQPPQNFPVSLPGRLLQAWLHSTLNRINYALKITRTVE
jgi:hypothetical protein